MSAQKTIHDDDLKSAYEKHKMLSKMAVELGVPEISIWRRCKQLGLEFKNGGKRTKLDLHEILEGKHPQFQTNKLKQRLLNEGVMENKCSCCGISEWNNKPITMQLDHIDGNSKNHLLENLRMLCPNCHSQTDTWCGKNK